jgi:hypothetical protein
MLAVEQSCPTAYLKINLVSKLASHPTDGKRTVRTIFTRLEAPAMYPFLRKGVCCSKQMMLTFDGVYALSYKDHVIRHTLRTSPTGIQ